MRRVLILEPYYGGSHRLFLRGLQETVPAAYTLLSLPARKWKMRMQLSAFWFVEEIRKMPVEERGFERVLCSTFVDVAVLRSLLLSVAGWNPRARVHTYFHENQFAYPGQMGSPDIRQFAAINLSSAMASDVVAFNSTYNRESFLGAIAMVLKKASDMKSLDCVRQIREKSVVLYPGMDYSSIDSARVTRKAVPNVPLTILWNHRWEHDKGPEIFFEALYQVQQHGREFRLMVLGESFATVPPCFEEARRRLSGEVVHFGFSASRKEYTRLLHQADLIVSTAQHEFFGIAVLEGIRAGCYPLLPRDLSYPELYGDQYLYKPGDLGQRLIDFLSVPEVLDDTTRHHLTDRFDWHQCRDQYIKWLFE